MIDNDPHITITDIRRIYCVKGARRVFDDIGVDFADFLKNGCSASVLRNKGIDGLVDRIVESMVDKDASNGR